MEIFNFLQLAKDRRDLFDIIYPSYGGYLGKGLYIDDLKKYKKESGGILLKFLIPFLGLSKETNLSYDSIFRILVDSVKRDSFVDLVHEDITITCKLDYLVKSDSSLEYILWCSTNGDNEFVYEFPQTRFDLLDI